MEEFKNIVKIESQRIIKITGEVQNETRYFIFSLEPDANVILNAVRSHWAIENKLHWMLDVTLNEDKSRKRHKNAAENFSVILRTTLNILKKIKKLKQALMLKD